MIIFLNILNNVCRSKSNYHLLQSKKTYIILVCPTVVLLIQFPLHIIRSDLLNIRLAIYLYGRGSNGSLKRTIQP